MSKIKKNKGALAIFVKTPGLSPIKTRLAQTIGTDKALEFYQLALRALKKILTKLQLEIPNVDIYFAVTEEEGLNSSHWGGFATLWQGNGGLGSKLSHTYNLLLHNYDFVCFMGADSPQISLDQIVKSVLTTAQNYSTSIVLGETQDGGFYFFGAGLPLTPLQWESITYSSDQTAKELQKSFMTKAPFIHLDTHFDIDVISDLEKLKNQNFSLINLIPEQIELISWVNTLKYQPHLTP